jgi:hypothetical protein
MPPGLEKTRPTQKQRHRNRLRIADRNFAPAATRALAYGPVALEVADPGLSTAPYATSLKQGVPPCRRV